jgi:hypothetical protein
LVYVPDTVFVFVRKAVFVGRSPKINLTDLDRPNFIGNRVDRTFPDAYFWLLVGVTTQHHVVKVIKIARFTIDFI